MLSVQVLTELEIAHVYHSAARNSPKRPEFEAKWGVMQFPYLEDPNSKVRTHHTPASSDNLFATAEIEAHGKSSMLASSMRAAYLAGQESKQQEKNQQEKNQQENNHS